MATPPDLGHPTAYIELVDGLVQESTQQGLTQESKQLAVDRIMDIDSPICALHEIYATRLEGDPDALPGWSEALANVLRLLPLPMGVIHTWTRNVNCISFVRRLDTLFMDSRPYAPQHDLENIATDAALPPIITDDYSNTLGKRGGGEARRGGKRRRME